MTAPFKAFDVLKSYLAARGEFSDGDWEIVEAAFLAKHVPAGAFLQRAGEVAGYAVFVARGCLRNYIIDDKGKEHIIQFAPETWWLADGISLRDRTPSTFFIEAIEESDVLLIEGPTHERLVAEIAGVATAFRAGIQRHSAAKDRRIATSLSASAEERYLEFLRVYPSIAERVPQLMLASYLGMSPETISRIRKNLSRR